LRPGNFALAGESAPGAGHPASPLPPEAPDAEVVRLPGYGRHAKAAESGPPPVPALPIRSAERRRWSADRGGTVAEAIAAADRADLPWAQRMGLLREHVLGRVPLLLVLDDFDDNLSLEAGTCTIRDPELIELLTSWTARPHRGRLLITCRHRFPVPDVAGPRIGFRHLGPLSAAGAAELGASLPGLGPLGEQDLDLVWRLLGGHPRAMEYLDGLLALCSRCRGCGAVS
jgi:hypothetical protein